MNIELNHILDKALELFRKYGIKSVSMDDISSELGVSKKTLYNLFKDKNELVEQTELYRNDIRQQHYEKIFNQKFSAIEELMALHGLMESFVLNYSKTFEHDLKKYYPDVYLSRYHERKKEIVEAIKRNLKKGIEDGVYRNNINIEILANYKISFFLYTAENEVENAIDVNNKEYFNEIFKVHLYGILSEKGRTEFDKKFKKTNKEDS